MSNVEAMAADLFATISVYIDKRVTAALEKLAADMQAKLDAIEIADTKRHEALLEEICTTDTNIEQLGVAIAELKAMPPPKDGEAGRDGKDADLGRIEHLEKLLFDNTASAMTMFEAHGNTLERHAKDLSALMAAPIPKDGEKGQPGDKGKDADPIDYDAIVKTCVALIPVPKDGASGEDGRDGRDSIQIEVLDVIDPERRYQRGTYAKYRGGRIRAFRATDPIGEGDLEKFGWTVDLEGVHEIGVKQDEDMRTFAIGVVLTSGKSFVEGFTVPVMIDRGPFKSGAKFGKGDVVSWDGSMWIAQMDMEKAGDRPGQPEWRLSVKHGRDGKNFDDPMPRNAEVVRLK